MAKKLLDIMRDKIRFKHYSIKTEQSYIGWAKRYIFFSLPTSSLGVCSSIPRLVVSESILTFCMHSPSRSLGTRKSADV